NGSDQSFLYRYNSTLVLYRYQVLYTDTLEAQAFCSLDGPAAENGPRTLDHFNPALRPFGWPGQPANQFRQLIHHGRPAFVLQQKFICQRQGLNLPARLVQFTEKAAKPAVFTSIV